METESTQPQETPETSPPDTQQAQNGGQVATEGTFTQADMDRVMTRTRKEARESAINQLLSELGVDDSASLKGLVSEYNKDKQAKMSETEKLQEQLDAMKAQVEAANAARAEIEAARLADKRDNGLMALLSDAHDAATVLTVFKAQQDSLDDFMQDGAFNKDVAEKAVNDFRSANAYLFKSDNPGSRSNKGGRVPSPDAKQKQQQAKSISQIINNM